MTLKKWISSLVDVVLPRVCQVCGTTLVEGEQVMCLECFMRLPRTGIHRNPGASQVMKFIAGAGVRRMASMFYYNKDGAYARMLKRAKYLNHPEIDHRLAAQFASELKSEGFFDGIDMLMPVPMHWRKLIGRGYNQAEEIAYGLSDITGIPVAYNLKAVKSHSTQTRKKAEERRSLSSDIFKVMRPDGLENKHVLLVDDIITTGATIMACAQVLRKAVPSLRISILSLALTSQS